MLIFMANSMIWRIQCLYGSEMVVLGVVLGKCEMPSTDISQENDHAILIVKR